MRGAMTKRSPHGKRFRLLIYERMWQRWASVCLLIAAASAALWWLAPPLGLFPSQQRILILAPVAGALCVFAYAFLARNRAWVQCRKTHLHIQTPVLPLVISYSRMRLVRPKMFHQVFTPESQRPARRVWLEPYWKKTTIAVALSDYPMSEFWLRLWFSPYLLNRQDKELILLVEDWMGLSRQLDDFRIRWQSQRPRRKPRQGG